MASRKKPNKNGNKKTERYTIVPDEGQLKSPFKDEQLEDDKVFIECPGVTVYEPGTRNVMAGARFVDEGDPSKGFEIVDKQIFAPGHKPRRIIKKDHSSSIRRCQACQDLTIRLMRREGMDFCIPNPRFPHRKNLKSIEKNW